VADRGYPCATRGTRVEPKALACRAMAVTLRSRIALRKRPRPVGLGTAVSVTSYRPKRASLWAVASWLWGPIRAFMAGKKRQGALCDGVNCGARRRAMVTRCAPGPRPPRQHWPPEILCWGHSQPATEVFTLGQRCMSVPTSLRMTKAVLLRSPRWSSVDACHAIQREGGIQTGFVALLCRRGLEGQG